MKTTKKPKMTLGLLLLTATLASCGGGSPVPVTAPGNPTSFTATATASNTVRLEWSAVSGASNFTLERKTNGGTYAQVGANLPANTLSYSDSALTPSTAYTYRLKAANSAGSSSGVERTVTTPAPGSPDFSLTAQPNALTVSAGRSGSVQIGIERPAQPEGRVALSLEGASVGSGPTKIQGAFGGAAGTTLTFNVGAEVAVGPHTLTVRGRNGAVEKTVQITVNVERWLVVDDDSSVNNSRFADPSYLPDSDADLRARGALTTSGRAFDVIVVPTGTGGYEPDVPDGPNAAQLGRYSHVVWYTGDQFGIVLTNDDLSSLSTFVDQPGRKLIMLAPGLIHEAVGGRNQMQQPDERFRPFLQEKVGVQQVAFGHVVGMTAYTLTGQPDTVTAGLNVAVAPSIRGYLLPGTGTQVLFKDGADILATGKAGTGTAGSSKVLLGAFSLGHVSQANADALLGRFINF